MQITFRKAEIADLEEVYRLVKDAVAHMKKQNIMQWDELYPTRDDLLTDIEKDQLMVGVIEGKIEKTLKASGIHAIRLDVFTQNPFALRLYERLGYEKTGYADWRKGRFVLMEKYI